MTTISTIIQDLADARLLVREADYISMPCRWLQAYLVGDSVLSAGGPALRQIWGTKAVIGLTGNIAVGKSMVLHELEALGAGVIDADQVVHELRQPGMPGYTAVVELLGREIVLEDGKLDTALLSARAFSSPELLQQLEWIFRPLVTDAVAQWARSSDRQVLVVEAIKLLEGDLVHATDEIWVVDAPEEEQIRRLVANRQLSVEEARRRVLAQTPQADKVAAADVVIQNAGSPNDMRWQVLSGWAGILRRLARAGWLIDRLVQLFIERSLATSGAFTSAERGEQVLRKTASLLRHERVMPVAALLQKLD